MIFGSMSLETAMIFRSVSKAANIRSPRKLIRSARASTALCSCCFQLSGARSNSPGRAKGSGAIGLRIRHTRNNPLKIVLEQVRVLCGSSGMGSRTSQMWMREALCMAKGIP